VRRRLLRADHTIAHAVTLAVAVPNTVAFAGTDGRLAVDQPAVDSGAGTAARHSDVRECRAVERRRRAASEQ
jgi:hypothetical protein